LNPPAQIKEDHIQKKANYGVHECTASLNSVDHRNLRRLVWKNQMRWWNISKMVHDASEGKLKAYLTRENLIQPRGSFFSVDLIGRPRQGKSGRLNLVREIHDPKQSMLCSGGIARIENCKVMAEVPTVKFLLPDSGGQVNEIDYETAQKLGLYTDNVPKVPGPQISTNTGSEDQSDYSFRPSRC
jgi:hypothetical protein